MQIIFKRQITNNCLLNYNVNTIVCRSTIMIHHSLKIEGYNRFYKTHVSINLNVVRKDVISISRLPSITVLFLWELAMLQTRTVVVLQVHE